MADRPCREAPAPDLHVALLAPEIPGNTGNVGRSCLAAGARLHLIKPLGFSLDDRHVRRSGLDYWRHVDKRVWPGWADFERALPGLGEPWFFSAEGGVELWRAPLEAPAVLVFGCESSGLPPGVRRAYRSRLVTIPMRAPESLRSLNLSSAAAVALFEARRRVSGPG
ncbi:MAG: tRNA (cytidine(34)-2'-O)-methyltransferase [Acidobacteriota bacterium]